MSDERDLRIAELMDERGLKPYPFAKANKIASSTMTSIYKGKVKFEGISISTFLKIAHGLGMTAEELYYGTKEDGCECSDRDEPSITADEQTIVDGYRAADDGQRLLMKTMANAVIEKSNADAREKKEAI